MFSKLAFDEVVRCFAEAWSEDLSIAGDLVQGRRPAAFGHIEQPIDALKGLQALEKHLGLALPRRNKLVPPLHLFRRQHFASLAKERLFLKDDKLNLVFPKPPNFPGVIDDILEIHPLDRIGRLDGFGHRQTELPVDRRVLAAKDRRWAPQLLDRGGHLRQRADDQLLLSHATTPQCCAQPDRIT
jgi:hypothetical protein